MAEGEEFDTSKGKALFVDPAGHIYVFETKGSWGKGIWRCERRKARVHVCEGNVEKEVNDHSHAPDTTKKREDWKESTEDLQYKQQNKLQAIVGRVLKTESVTVLWQYPPPEPEDLNFDVPPPFSTWSPGGVEETLIK